MDGAGVLGQYDIILTVRYAKDKFLAKFVMEYIQLKLEEGNTTTTMPAIQGMTYPILKAMVANIQTGRDQHGIDHGI